MGEREGKIELRVDFPPSPDVMPVYANHVTAQFLGSEFVISFYAAFPPMLSPDEARKSEIINVEAKCVARLVISRERMPDIARALSENVSQATAGDGNTNPQPRGARNG